MFASTFIVIEQSVVVWATIFLCFELRDPLGRKLSFNTGENDDVHSLYISSKLGSCQGYTRNALMHIRVFRVGCRVIVLSDNVNKKNS